MTIALPIRLLETADEQYAVKGTTGEMWENEKGRFFRPYNANEEFKKEYPEELKYSVVNTRL